MLPFLQYLIALILVEHAEATVGPTVRPDAAGILLGLAAFALAARVVGVVLARRSANDADRTFGRFLLATTVGRLAALLTFQTIVTRFAAVRLPSALGIDRWVLVPHLVRLAPFLALVAGLAWGLHPASAALRVGARTAARAVADEFRQALLPLAPILLLGLLGDLARLVPPTSGAGVAFTILGELPAIQAFGVLAAVFGSLLAVPFVLRLVLRMRPLPEGTLRTRLEAYSRRIGLRFRDILVWPTGGDVINAAVIGALPRFRYVIVTDALLSTLSEDEIEAVFAHEAGHARRGHILLFFGFTAVFGLIGFVPGLAGVAGAVLAPLPPLARSLVVVLLWLGIVFGWISRRFEQEADVFGIETVPLADPGADPASHPFARAMERIGNEVGAIREVTGWRHFSIADRVEFVRRYLTDETVRRGHRRSILLLRTMLLVVICGFTLSAAVRVPGEIANARRQWDARSAPESRMLVTLHDALGAASPDERAFRFFEASAFAALAGRPGDSTRWLRESVALVPHDPPRLAAYAQMLERTGRPAGARLVWEEIAARDDVPPQLRDAARRKSAAAGSR